MPTFDVTVTVFITSSQTLNAKAEDKRQAVAIAKTKTYEECHEWVSGIHEVRIDDIEQIEED